MRKKLTYALLTALLLTLGSFAVYAFAPVEYIPGNITFADTQITSEGEDTENIEKKVAEILVPYQNRVFTVINNKGNKRSFNLAELGIRYDVEKNTKQLMSTTNWFKSTFLNTAEATSTKQKNFRPIADINRNVFRETLTHYLKETEEPANDAKIYWNNTRWDMSKEASGIRLKDEEAKRIEKQVIVQLHPGSALPEIEAVYEEVSPKMTEAMLTPIYEKANTIAKYPLKLELEHETYNLRIEGDAWITIDPTTQTLRLNEDTAKNWVGALREWYDQPSGTVVIRNAEEVESEYDGEMYTKAKIDGDFSKGRRVDVDTLLEKMRAYIQNPTPNTRIVVPTEFTDPIIFSRLNRYAFNELLASGRSSYRLGNYRDRVHNIEKSLLSLDGIIIEPGQEFSFNRVTGWITPAKGYTKTKVIVDGEIVEGVGGGVCQSSTTAYRAAIHAGLDIVERTPHSLDVEYYHAYGYGIDAAVYTDSRSDLRFANNTGNPILIHTYLTANNEAFVELYGTNDGRNVTVENIPTGNPKHKKWAQTISYPETIGKEQTVKYLESKYRDPKPKEEEGEGEE